jgi:hypothetical protein
MIDLGKTMVSVQIPEAQVRALLVEQPEATVDALLAA